MWVLLGPLYHMCIMCIFIFPISCICFLKETGLKFLLFLLLIISGALVFSKKTLFTPPPFFFFVFVVLFA